MINSNYRWVMVAAGGLLGCVAIGGMFSLPVLLQPIARDTGWSVTGISSAMTVGSQVAISQGGGNTLTLNNVALTNLTSADFAFV